MRKWSFVWFLRKKVTWKCKACFAKTRWQDQENKLIKTKKKENCIIIKSLIVNRGNEKGVSDVQAEIQNKLEVQYEVEQPET